MSSNKMSNYITAKGTNIELMRVTNDVNGNPRYVIHYSTLSTNYKEALLLSKKFGGKVYRSKKFGGGIVFQSYNLSHTFATIGM